MYKEMGNIEFFNELARKGGHSNARMASLDFNIYEKTFADIDRKLGFSAEDSVLDLGGGTGEITELIAGKVKGVVLADGAEEAIAAAKKRLERRQNISYKHLDFEKLPLPFTDNTFDKIVCYSIVHYLSGHDQFVRLAEEMQRIVKSGGKILIADIPLADKGSEYLQRRKQNLFQNFFGNLKYYLKKYFTKFSYRLRGINDKQISGISFTRDVIENLLEKAGCNDYKWAEQDPGLPFANSREDLLITKNK